MTTPLYEADRNEVCLTGVLECTPAYSYSFHERPIYESMLKVQRRSGAEDYIPLIGEKHTLSPLNAGERVTVNGRILTRNKDNYPDARYRFSTLATEVIRVPEDTPNANTVFLTGHVCREPYARTTAQTHKDICELTVAIQRGTGEQDYCTCIAFNRLARLAALLNVGDAVSIEGRFQSRDYIKALGDGSRVRKMAHEIAITTFS